MSDRPSLWSPQMRKWYSDAAAHGVHFMTESRGVTPANRKNDPGGKHGSAAGGGQSLHPNYPAWDPATSTGHLSFTNNNNTATCTAATNGCFATTGLVVGVANKIYFETTVSWASLEETAGLGSKSVVILTDSYATLETLNCVVFGNVQESRYYVNGTQAASWFPTEVTSGTLQWAVDFGAELIWVNVPPGTSTTWNNNVSANPATGVGGVSISSMAGQTLFPFCNFALGLGGSDSCTINTGASPFVYTVPAGFGNFPQVLS